MQVEKVLRGKITKVNEKICMISYKFFCSLKKKVFLEAKKSKRCFFLQCKKKDKIRPKRWYPMLVFLSKNTKQHNFVFCGLNQHFVFFHFFLPMIKKINTFFFHFCFRQLKESSPFVPVYFFQTPSKFQAALCHTQTRLCFLRTFHNISCFLPTKCLSCCAMDRCYHATKHSSLRK